MEHTEGESRMEKPIVFFLFGLHMSKSMARSEPGPKSVGKEGPIFRGKEPFQRHAKFGFQSLVSSFWLRWFSSCSPTRSTVEESTNLQVKVSKGNTNHKPNSNIWVFPKIGGKTPKWMVKIMENPMNKWDDLGY